jgi:hypothetical protein
MRRENEESRTFMTESQSIKRKVMTPTKQTLCLQSSLLKLRPEAYNKATAASMIGYDEDIEKEHKLKERA